MTVRGWDGVWEVRTSLTVTVIDDNDNIPEFDRQLYSFNVSSDAVNIFFKLNFSFK